MSIRGQLPAGLYHQFILTFNPWSDKHWIKRRFFDNPDENTLAMTTNYKMNEFLSESDLRLYEIMKERYPRRYRIEGLGEWGIAEGLIYENWREEDFNIEELIEKNKNKVTERGLQAFVQCCGMDFGYTDATAFTAMYVDRKEYKIYIYFELFGSMMENRKIAKALIDNGFGNAIIYGDSEDPRTIRELQLLSVRGIRPVKKGAGSVLAGIQKLQDFEIIVHPRCQHTIEALSNYAWKKDKISDQILPVPEHDYSHIPDSIRYATSEISGFGIMV
jgi:phage terminase large subunit